MNVRILNRNQQPPRSFPELFDHRASDQRHAVLGAPEALRVKIRVLADNEAVGNTHFAVDHHLVQSHMPADPRVRQNDGLVDRRVRMDVYAGEYQRSADRGAGDDTAAGDHRLNRRATVAYDVLHELRGRRDLSVRPDRPSAVIEVELWGEVGEVDIRRPIGVDGSDVAPVVPRLRGRPDAGLREVVRDGFAVLDECGE